MEEARAEGAWEARYRSHYRAHDRGIYRMGIVLPVIPCVAFIHNDYLLFQASGMFAMLVAARLAFFLLSVTAVAAVSRADGSKWVDSIVLLWSLALCAMVFLINGTRPPDYMDHMFFDGLMLMTLYFFFPLPPTLQAIAPLVFTAGNIAILYYAKDPLSPTQINVIWATYFLGNALGLYTVHRMWRYRRAHFLALDGERALRIKLEESLDSLKTLQGLLPICAHCKKIRDDHGSWTQVEKYISTHSEAEFSHGICPDCVRVHYADIDLES